MNSRNLYVYGEDPSASLLYFTLDTSRHEPALKRINIIMVAGKFCHDDRISSECYNLACELMDVEQIVQKHIAFVRDAYAEELAENATWSYLLERIEDQELETKVELLGTMAVVEGRQVTGLHDSWSHMYSEVKRFNQRFETFLFKIRTRFHQGSNRDASAADAAEEAAKQAAEISAKGNDATKPAVKYSRGKSVRAAA